MTAWTDLVKKIYGENKHKKGYKLGHAMKAGKKIYKTIKAAVKRNGKTAKKRGGEVPELTKEPVKIGGGDVPELTKEPVKIGGGDVPELTKEPVKIGGKKKNSRRR